MWHDYVSSIFKKVPMRVIIAKIVHPPRTGLIYVRFLHVGDSWKWGSRGGARKKNSSAEKPPRVGNRPWMQGKATCCCLACKLFCVATKDTWATGQWRVRVTCIFPLLSFELHLMFISSRNSIIRLEGPQSSRLERGWWDRRPNRLV